MIAVEKVVQGFYEMLGFPAARGHVDALSVTQNVPQNLFGASQVAKIMRSPTFTSRHIHQIPAGRVFDPALNKIPSRWGALFQFASTVL